MAPLCFAISLATELFPDPMSPIIATTIGIFVLRRGNVNLLVSSFASEATSEFFLLSILAIIRAEMYSIKKNQTIKNSVLVAQYGAKVVLLDRISAKQEICRHHGGNI